MAQASTKATVIREIMRSILLNAVVPFGVYVMLKGNMPEVRALEIAVIIPVLVNLLLFIKTRRVDVFGIFMLSGLLLTLLLVMLGGGKQLLLIRTSLISGLLGLAMLVTLFLPRPMIFYFAMRFAAGQDTESQAEYRARWERQAFRRVMYLMTLVWGCALVLEAVIRTLLAFLLPTTTFLAIAPFVEYGILLGTIWWTVFYARLARRRAKAAVAA